MNAISVGRSTKGGLMRSGPTDNTKNSPMVPSYGGGFVIVAFLFYVIIAKPVYIGAAMLLLIVTAVCWQFKQMFNQVNRRIDQLEKMLSDYDGCRDPRKESNKQKQIDG